MKKAMLFLSIVSLLTSCCLSQIPSQYVYIDEQCEATLPDYTPIVVAEDNCDVPSVVQFPQEGDIISGTTEVEIRAIDGSGNSRAVYFDVVILDTIPPTIQMDTTWVGYSDKEVGDMYRTVYGWIQLTGVEFNSVLPFEEYPQIDSMKVFVNNITIPDRTRDDWWWGTN